MHSSGISCSSLQDSNVETCSKKWHKKRAGAGERERERFLSQIARLDCFILATSPVSGKDSQPGTGYPENTRSLLSSPHMMIPDSNEISNVRTNPGHPDRTACYLWSVFQKYIYQCFLALGIRDLRLPITTCAISTALFLDTCTFLKAKQSYTVSFQYNILSHT